MSLSSDLVREFEHAIESLEIIPSDGGRFEVHVNGTLVFSKKELGRHAEPGEVAGILRMLVNKK